MSQFLNKNSGFDPNVIFPELINTKQIINPNKYLIFDTISAILQGTFYEISNSVSKLMVKNFIELDFTAVDQVALNPLFSILLNFTSINPLVNKVVLQLSNVPIVYRNFFNTHEDLTVPTYNELLSFIIKNASDADFHKEIHQADQFLSNIISFLSLIIETAKDDQEIFTYKFIETFFSGRIYESFSFYLSLSSEKGLYLRSTIYKLYSLFVSKHYKFFLKFKYFRNGLVIEQINQDLKRSLKHYIVDPNDVIGEVK